VGQGTFYPDLTFQLNASACYPAEVIQISRKRNISKVFQEPYNPGETPSQ